MVDIEQFPEDTYKTLIALPYRVGLYVSLSDQAGGGESEARELAALENVVTFYVEDTLKSEFAQSIMLATLQHKAYWPEWREGIETVPSECRDIVSYLEDRVEPRKLLAFKNNLLEIAVAVAMAYQETSMAKTFFEKIKNMLAFHKAKPDAAGINPYLNISPAEKIAINNLADIFGISHKVA